MSGHSMRHGESDGTVGPRQRTYIARRAQGGAALVSLESIPVHESSRNFDRQIRLYSDRCIPGLAKLAESVHESNARLSAILWHGGPNVSHFGRGPAWAPSAICAPGTGEVAKPISTKEIAELVASYASAAARCRKAGLDSIEVQLASNYLLGSFLSPALNQRSDGYGGVFANRIRIVIEVLTAVRESLQGTLALGVRASLDHGMEGERNFGKGESMRVLDELAQRGLVDWISVLSGSAYARGTSIPTMDLPRAFLAAAAAEVREKIGLPTIVAGRVRTAAEAEAILAGGQADLIAMARPLIADPDWMNKVSAGREAEIRPCISCNQGCLGFNLRNKPGSCVVNPDAGREFQRPARSQAKTMLRVAVIGAGPAGMELATSAAGLGHRVTLFEAQPNLGGDLQLAAGAPHRQEMGAAVDWWCAELARLGVEIQTNVEIKSPPAGFDRVCWALGSSPSQLLVRRRRPHLQKGITGADTLPHGRHLMAQGAQLEGEVLIIDEEGGWPSISLAEWLAAQPSVSRVTVATPVSEWGLPELHLTAEIGALKQRLENGSIEVLTNRLVDRVESSVAYTQQGEVLGPFQHLVLATGTSARLPPEPDLAIGDCVAPRGIWAAVNDARRLVGQL